VSATNLAENYSKQNKYGKAIHLMHDVVDILYADVQRLSEFPDIAPQLCRHTVKAMHELMYYYQRSGASDDSIKQIMSAHYEDIRVFLYCICENALDN
jgi:hypothetical protein